MMFLREDVVAVGFHRPKRKGLGMTEDQRNQAEVEGRTARKLEDDVEGHARTTRKMEDDVEGHARSTRKMEDDVEGHRK